MLSSWQADQHTRSVRCFPLASRGLSRRPSCARALRTIIVRRSLGRAVVLEPSLRVLLLLRRCGAQCASSCSMNTCVFSLLPIAFTLGGHTLLFLPQKRTPFPLGTFENALNARCIRAQTCALESERMMMLAEQGSCCSRSLSSLWSVCWWCGKVLVFMSSVHTHLRPHPSGTGRPGFPSYWGTPDRGSGYRTPPPGRPSGSVPSGRAAPGSAAA